MYEQSKTSQKQSENLFPMALNNTYARTHPMQEYLGIIYHIAQAIKHKIWSPAFFLPCLKGVFPNIYNVPYFDVI